MTIACDKHETEMEHELAEDKSDESSDKELLDDATTTHGEIGSLEVRCRSYWVRVLFWQSCALQ
jgi:hypothetical protein